VALLALMWSEWARAWPWGNAIINRTSETFIYYNMLILNLMCLQATLRSLRHS
jgi:hypothetical protein